MKELYAFISVLRVGAGRQEAEARKVCYKLDDCVHHWLVPRLRKRFFFDRWGIIRTKHARYPLQRMITGAQPTDTLRCINGDLFDLRQCNWKPIPFKC